MLSGGESGIVEWLDRIRGEYLEMPGLPLTERQAQRLWNLDSAAIRTLLQALLETRFIRRTREGRYVRNDESPSVERSTHRSAPQAVIVTGAVSEGG
jgi:hypothetical protein